MGGVKILIYNIFLTKDNVHTLCINNQVKTQYIVNFFYLITICCINDVYGLLIIS